MLLCLPTVTASWALCFIQFCILLPIPPSAVQSDSHTPVGILNIYSVEDDGDILHVTLHKIRLGCVLFSCGF